MTNEGDLNKVDGNVFFDGDITAIVNIQGIMFQNQANLLWNASLIGYDSDLTEEFLNLQQDDLDDNSQIDTTNSDIDDVPVFPAALMDNHDDSSIDAAIWTTAGTVSEDSTEITVSGSGGGGHTSSATADQGSSVDLNSDGIILFVKVSTLAADYAAGSASATIAIIDDSANTVIIENIGQNETNIITDTMFRININTGNNTAGISTDITSTDDTGTDISSLVDGDTWHFKISTTASASGGSATVTAKVKFERFIDGSAETDDFISATTTASSTIINAILAVSEDTDAGTINYFLSADNGANYEAVTPNINHNFINTGTQLKMKATMVSTTSDIPILYHQASIFNIF